MNNKSKISLNPFCFTVPSVSTITIGFICVLIPHIIMLFITKSYNSIILILCSTISSCMVEIIDSIFIRKKNTDTLTALMQGILIGMLIPSEFPPIALCCIVFFMLYISKYIFGSLASSWLNPIAITVICTYFIGTLWFPSYKLSIEQIQMQNLSLQLIQDGTFPVYKFDTNITDFLNEFLFSFLGTNIPDGYISLLWDSGSTIPAFRFNLLTILASLILFSLKIIDWKLPTFYIGTYAVLVRLFCPMIVGGNFGNGDIILSLLTGGTLFSAFFVASWFGTLPFTNVGKIFFGCILGISAFFISGYGLSATGAMFSIFITNIVSLFIQVAEQKRNKSILIKKKIISAREKREQENEYQKYCN